MRPNQVASMLRRIASKIEASKNPSKNAVASDLKKIIATISDEYSPRQGDKVTVRELGNNKFRVEGVLGDLSGPAVLSGVAITRPDSVDIEFIQDDGSQLDENTYDTLVDIFNDWRESYSTL